MSSKYMWVLALLGVVVAYGMYSVFVFWRASKMSAPLVSAATPYNREVTLASKNILVLGDSLAVGVGAPGENSVAGKLSMALNANVENYAKSGAQTRDLDAQLQKAKQERYDLILIQMGANDIIRLQSLSIGAENMDRALREARTKSDHVVFLSAGDVGDAPLWPWLWRKIYTSRTRDLRENYSALAETHSALYIDLYARGNLFASDPKRFYAADKLHLSADGYTVWFSIILEELQARWPEFK